MFRTDTGNFNRFLTSAGLAFLAAALVIPYFYFSSTDVLTISSSDLKTMTSQGRSAVLGRQHAIAQLEPWVIVAAVLLAALGGVLLVAGALRLKAAQASEDEETELRKDRARLEMKSLSPQEREEKAFEKAREDGREEAAALAVPKEESIRRSGRSSGQAAVAPALYPSLQMRQLAVARIERGIEDAFKASPPATHRLKAQLKMSSRMDAIQLDGLFEAIDAAMPDVVLQTRVAFAPSFAKSARMVADELVAKSSRYQAMTHRDADAWLVTVLPAELDASDEVVAAARESLDSALGTFGIASVVREAELDGLPPLFATHFGHVYLL